jgi:hypothetical protein
VTEDFFGEQMARLCGLRFVPPDLVTHWEALHDLPDEVLAGAVSLAGRTRVDFPTPVQLRQDADKGRRPWTHDDTTDHSTLLPEPYTVVVPHTNTAILVTREWRYHCDDCSDGGWRSRWCGDPTHQQPWHRAGPCAGRGDHPAHEWVERCPCAETNPALVKKRALGQKYAEPEKGPRLG